MPSSRAADLILAKALKAGQPLSPLRPRRFLEQQQSTESQNPTSQAEGILEVWTEGRAVIGTGNPFPPLTRGGIKIKVEPRQTFDCCFDQESHAPFRKR
jgi:hypothetical protein